MKPPWLLMQPAFGEQPAVALTHSSMSTSQSGPSYLHHATSSCLGLSEMSFWWPDSRLVSALRWISKGSWVTSDMAVSRERWLVHTRSQGSP